MDSSRGFGSHPCHWRPLQTRFPCGCPTLAWVNLSRWRDTDALAGSFYKRHAISPEFLMEQWPLTAGEYVVSGSLSSPLRGAFHLSLTVLVHYRSLKVLSLGGWSPQLPTNSPGFVVLRDPTGSCAPCSTGLSPPVVTLSNVFESAAFALCVGPYNPSCSEEHQVWAPPVSLATTPGISFDFFSSGY
jgi:hypothetical protein